MGRQQDETSREIDNEIQLIIYERKKKLQVENISITKNKFETLIEYLPGAQCSCDRSQIDVVFD